MISKPKNKPARDEAALEQFINGAPVGVTAPAPAPVPTAAPEPISAQAPARRVKMIGGRAVVSVSLDPQVLVRIDDAAARMGVGRSAFLAMAVAKMLEGVQS